MKRNSFFDFSLDAALYVSRGTSVIIEAAAEFTGQHDGQEVDLALRQFIPALGITGFIKAGLKRQNKKLTSFPYGVQGATQLSIRAAYDPRHVFISYIAANAIYGVIERISLFGNTGLTFYRDKVIDSPTVYERTSFNLVGRLAFTF